MVRIIEKIREQPVMVYIVGVFLIILAFGAVYGVIDQHQKSEWMDIYFRADSYCFDRTNGSDLCMQWAGRSLEANKDKVYACHYLHPVLDTPFGRCLADEGMIPPIRY